RRFANEKISNTNGTPTPSQSAGAFQRAGWSSIVASASNGLVVPRRLRFRKSHHSEVRSSCLPLHFGACGALLWTLAHRRVKWPVTLLRHKRGTKVLLLREEARNARHQTISRACGTLRTACPRGIAR